MNQTIYPAHYQFKYIVLVIFLHVFTLMWVLNGFNGKMTVAYTANNYLETHALNAQQTSKDKARGCLVSIDVD